MLMYLDCEFNSYKGDLISMALVTADGREWYETLPCSNPDPWVAENVMPVLNKDPLSNQLEMSKSLEKFLRDFSSVYIIADWPDDVKYFNDVLITGPGERIDTPPIEFTILRIDAESQQPHNALADAHGIRKYVMENNFEDLERTHGPGSPSYRLKRLLGELDKRFPNPALLTRSDELVEDLHLKMIDQLIAENALPF